MDSNLIILAFSAIVIAAYAFDVLCRKVKLPSIILLLLSGIAIRQLFDRVGWSLPYLEDVLPVLGTIGLVLIVLEGALDLKLTHEKKPLIMRTLVASILGFLLSLAAIAVALHEWFATDWARAFLTACPFAVISSAVAIPSVVTLPKGPAEFVVYESSLSDIIGVLVFYALLAAKGDVSDFVLGLGVTGVVSLALGLVFTAGLYVLLNRLTGHVKHLPIFFALLLLYSLGKQFHLSPLMLVLAFGLLLNNVFLLDRIKWLKQHESESFAQDLTLFKQIVMEGAFFVRTFFFLLLGFSTDLIDFVSSTAWVVTGAIVVLIYATRWPLLRVLCPADSAPLLWIAPRGLITVVLFLNLPEPLRIAHFPTGTVMLVVLTTAVLLGAGIRANASSASAPAEGAQGTAEP
jgi:NhaP-type Na+/H+ or K+/H+ antiporter